MELKRISPEEAQKLIDEEGYVYLDVRSIPEFEAGHPSGAYNVPLMHMGQAGMEPNPDFLDVVQANFPKDAKLVVGCKSGGRSQRAAQHLLQAGYQHVIDQRAGFAGATDSFGQLAEAGWEPKQLPVSQQPEPDHDYQALAENAGTQ